MKDRINLSAIAIEMISIVFAVLFALGVNEWRQNRADALLAEKALDGMLSEMETNRKLFARELPGHRALLDTLMETQAMIAAGRMSADTVMNDLHFNPMLVRDAAWKTAMATQALIHMDFKTASLISDVYAIQKIYQDMLGGLFETSLALDNFAPEKEAEQLKYIVTVISIFTQVESQLLERYESALDSLGSP